MSIFRELSEEEVALVSGGSDEEGGETGSESTNQQKEQSVDFSWGDGSWSVSCCSGSFGPISGSIDVFEVSGPLPDAKPFPPADQLTSPHNRL